MSIGQRVELLRQSAGLTHAQLAAICGYTSAASIRNIERGASHPSPVFIRTLLLHFAIPSQVFYDDEALLRHLAPCADPLAPCPPPTL